MPAPSEVAVICRVALGQRRFVRPGLRAAAHSCVRKGWLLGGALDGYRLTLRGLGVIEARLLAQHHSPTGGFG